MNISKKLKNTWFAADLDRSFMRKYELGEISKEECIELMSWNNSSDIKEDEFDYLFKESGYKQPIIF